MKRLLKRMFSGVLALILIVMNPVSVLADTPGGSQGAGNLTNAIKM